MFSDFSSSDKGERDSRAFKRLCSLRAARLAGYFDEPVLERGEWPSAKLGPIIIGERKDIDFDAWLREQPRLANAIDRLNAALSGSWWDYESKEGFRGHKA